MRSAIAIIAKSPMRGRVKTRLCPPLTPDEATELYRAFLLDTIELIAELDGIEPGIIYTPDEAHADFRALAPAHFFLVRQDGVDLGERLANGFRDLFARGYAAAVIMDADSPTLPRVHLQTMFAQLRDPHCDVTIGPCDDGGYYAIGMKKLRREVFRDITWSTAVVFAQTLRRAHDANLTIACAPAWYDVDNGDALERLRAELNDSPALMPVHTRDTLAILNALNMQLETK